MLILAQSSDKYLFVGDSKFASAVYRLFKVKSQNGKSSEATYKGGIPGAENQFVFDNEWTFKVELWILISIFYADRFQII